MRRTVTMRLAPTAVTQIQARPAHTGVCLGDVAGRAAGAEGTQAQQSSGTSAHCPSRTEPFSGSGCCRHPLSLEGGPQPSAKAAQSHSTTWPGPRDLSFTRAQGAPLTGEWKRLIPVEPLFKTVSLKFHSDTAHVCSHIPFMSVLSLAYESQ